MKRRWRVPRYVLQGRTPDEELCEAVSALGAVPRLRLLRQLTLPRTLSELEVISGHGERDRVLSRQATRAQLDRLLEAGLVARQESRQPGRGPNYVVNHQTIFSLAEEVRQLARLRPAVEVVSPTPVSGDVRQATHAAPCLVVVHGLDDGAAFDLHPQRTGRDTWLIGRRRYADICLDFDAFASGENTIITYGKERHWVQNVEGSRNGTFLNFKPLKGTSSLEHGDLIGVGRSLLLFWAHTPHGQTGPRTEAGSSTHGSSLAPDALDGSR